MLAFFAVHDSIEIDRCKRVLKNFCCVFKCDAMLAKILFRLSFIPNKPVIHIQIVSLVNHTVSGVPGSVCIYHFKLCSLKRFIPYFNSKLRPWSFELVGYGEA